MKFIDYNFVSDDAAAKIMESYGYESEAIVEEDLEDAEEVVAEHRYLYENDGFAFSLQEGVEEALDMGVYLAGELLRLKELKKKLLSKEHDKDDDGKDVFKSLFGKDY